MGPTLAVRPARRCMTAPNSDRRVIHVELDITGSKLRYKPGDSIGVLPQNPPDLVEALLKRLGLNGQETFSLAKTDGPVDVAGVYVFYEMGLSVTMCTVPQSATTASNFKLQRISMMGTTTCKYSSKFETAKVLV